MNETNNLLSLVSHCWGFPTMDSIYNLNVDALIFLTFSSFIICFIFDKYLNKTDFKVSIDQQIEIGETMQYSFLTKVLVLFFVLVLITMPIFKLLNTGYFL